MFSGGYQSAGEDLVAPVAQMLSTRYTVLDILKDSVSGAYVALLFDN